MVDDGDVATIGNQHGPDAYFTYVAVPEVGLLSGHIAISVRPRCEIPPRYSCTLPCATRVPFSWLTTALASRISGTC